MDQVTEGGSVPLLGTTARRRHECINWWSCIISSLVFGLILCYPIALCLGGGIPEEPLEPTDSQECIPSISGEDQKKMLTAVLGSSKLVYINLTVNLNSTCRTCAAFAPMVWVWVSSGSSEVFTFLSWQEDYSIWSFGILDLYITRNINISLQFSPQCGDKFGDAHNMKMIGHTLNNMSANLLNDAMQDYNQSLWCYREKRNVLTPTEHTFVENFRYFVQDLNTPCYQLLNNTLIVEGPDRQWTNIAFSITYIALLLSPVIHAWCRHAMSNKSPLPWVAWGADIGEDFNDRPEYCYQGFKSPITLSSMVFGLLPASIWKSQPLACCFKILLLLVSPIVIYIKVMIYHINHDLDFLLWRQVDHNISIGFSAMLVPDFLKKSNNFLTFTYGPCIFFIVYYATGIILIIIHAIFLEVKLEDDVDDSMAPLASLHLSQMESMRNVTITNKTLNIAAENTIKRALSKSFLKHMWPDEGCVLCKVLKWMSSFLFHQIPILFTSHLFLRTSLKRIADRNFNILAIFSLCFILGACHFIFLFAFATVFFASFEFLALITTYTYIAMVTYPGESAGYFLFGVSAGTYLLFCLRNIALRYQNLLSMSVHVCKKIEKQHKLENISIERPFFKRDHGSCGIRSDLFEAIVNRFEPRFKTIKYSMINLVAVICVLYWTLKLLFKLHAGSYDFSPLVHIFSAFVAVSLPNLIQLLLNDFTQETRYAICKEKIHTYIENLLEPEVAASRNLID